MRTVPLLAVVACVCVVLLGCLSAARPALAGDSIEAFPFYNLCDPFRSPANTDGGVIVSHGRFGSDDFPQGTSCTLTIATPVGYSVRISITDVDHEAGWEYLRISDGIATELVESPQTLTFESQTTVSFSSGYNYNSRGFRLLYQFVEDGDEPEAFPTGRTFSLYRVCGRSYGSDFPRGVLFTHRRYGFGSHNNNEDCYTRVNVEGPVTFYVEDFSLESCCDTLYYTPANGVRTRITSTGTFTVEGPVGFSFDTDGSVTYAGVRILFQPPDQVATYGWGDLSASADNAETNSSSLIVSTGLIIFLVFLALCLIGCAVTCCCVFCNESRPSRTTDPNRTTRVAAHLVTSPRSTTTPTIQMHTFNADTAPPYTPTAEQSPPQQQQQRPAYLPPQQGYLPPLTSYPPPPPPPPQQPSYPPPPQQQQPQPQQQQYPPEQPSQSLYPPSQTQPQPQPQQQEPSNAPVASVVYPDAPPSYNDVVGNSSSA